jgi:hypothetical protein
VVFYSERKMNKKKLKFPPLEPDSKIHLDNLKKADKTSLMWLACLAAAEWRDQAYEMNIPIAWANSDAWDDFRREHCGKGEGK